MPREYDARDEIEALARQYAAMTEKVASHDRELTRIDERLEKIEKMMENVPLVTKAVLAIIGMILTSWVGAIGALIYANHK